MLTSIRAWGNSQGICIPKKLLAEVSLSINDPVELSIVDGSIMISKGSNNDRKEKALTSLRTLRALHSGGNASVSDDYKKEIEEYLDEKYGR